ncbi:MAG: hypothetical protein KDA28_06160 [Phycisphaerales bacterium]|nr:hypothetical protein [Phycisphaerales bacterium]
MTRLILIVTSCLASLLLLAACEQKVTLENYEQITLDVTTLSEAKSILGDGRNETTSGVGISSSGMMQSSTQNSDETWIFEEGDAMIILTVNEDDIVVSKRKKNLE